MAILSGPSQTWPESWAGRCVAGCWKLPGPYSLCSLHAKPRFMGTWALQFLTNLEVWVYCKARCLGQPLLLKSSCEFNKSPMASAPRLWAFSWRRSWPIRRPLRMRPQIREKLSKALFTTHDVAHISLTLFGCGVPAGNDPFPADEHDDESGMECKCHGRADNKGEQTALGPKPRLGRSRSQTTATSVPALSESQAPTQKHYSLHP